MQSPFITEKTSLLHASRFIASKVYPDLSPQAGIKLVRDRILLTIKAGIITRHGESRSTVLSTQETARWAVKIWPVLANYVDIKLLGNQLEFSEKLPSLQATGTGIRLPNTLEESNAALAGAQQEIIDLNSTLNALKPDLEALQQSRQKKSERKQVGKESGEKAKGVPKNNF